MIFYQVVMGYPLQSYMSGKLPESKRYPNKSVVNLIENRLKLQYFRKVDGNTCSGIPPLNTYPEY